MGATENTLFYLGFIIKRTDEGVITISDMHYKDENNVSFKKIEGVIVYLPDETVIPSDIKEHGIMPVSVYSHIAKAANAFFDKINKGGK